MKYTLLLYQLPIQKIYYCTIIVIIYYDELNAGSSTENLNQ